MWLWTFLYYVAEARGRVDAVVTEGFGGSRIPRFAPLYVREPLITEWHQIHADLFAAQYPKMLVPVLNLLERLTAFVHRNTIVVARTEDWREAFPKIGFKPANIRVVPACISEHWLDSKPPDLTKQPNFAWLGKFRRYKCPDHAIRAMSHVVKLVPNARLTLAGFHDDRAYESELRNLTKQLNLEAAIVFRFGVSDDEKRDLLDACKALVLPSTVEGFGIVVLEANARRVPVIASSGVPDGAVSNGRNGLKFRFGAIDELADRMVQIATDNALLAELSASSWAFARQFEWRDVCALYESVIGEAVTGRSKGDHSVAGPNISTEPYISDDWANVVKPDRESTTGPHAR